MIHLCHAHGCSEQVPARLFMCSKHWHSVPKNLQDAIWREYRSGQETDKQPSARYLAVQQLAIMHAVFRPNSEQAAQIAARYLFQAMKWRAVALEAGDGDPLSGLIPSEVR